MKTYDYSKRIAGALDYADPERSITAVKTVVADELRTLDPTMKIEATQYFNHSFSPDFVASWPKDPQTPKRFIYLKISSQLHHLFEDVGLVEDLRPIVFGLGSTPTGSADLKQEVRDTTLRTNTLITDADGIEELITHNQSRFVSLASNAVAQGGRGVVDESRGAETARRLEAGFEGALAVDSASTRSATETLESLLDVKYADRMTRLLQAVWMGAGGLLSDFPGRLDVTSRISDEALQFLFEYEEIGDQDFWKRLGRGVGIHQLGRLALPDGSANLEHFIRANIHDISTRACRVLAARPNPEKSRSKDGLKWFVDGGRRLLALRGHDFTAVFGANLSDLGQVRRDRNSGISVRELQHRAVSSVITEAELLSLSSNGRRTVKLTSEDHTSLLRDLSENRVFAESGPEATVIVKRAGAAIDARDRVLTCDFQTATAYRRTSSKITLAELAGAGLPLLHSMSGRDLDALAFRTRSPEDIGLFGRFEIWHSDADPTSDDS